MAKKGLLVLLLLSLSLGTSAVWAKDEGRKPPTKVTEKLSPKVYEKIEAAQVALEAKDLATAESLMLELKADFEKMNDYEKSQTWNFLAAIHYEQGKTEETIRDYIAIVKLEKVPEQLKNNALFRLAQLYFVQEDYARSVKLLERWMQTQSEGIRPEAYMLKAQAYYQMEQYAAAEEPILQAMREARKREQPLRESWLGLLRAVYYETEQYKKAVRVLAEMIQRWPKPNYYKQLSGMLGLMGQQKGQLYVMHAAYVAGMLENEFEILNMARLYMAEDAPYPAVEVIQQGMAAGTIEETAANLQLLAQAMALAKDSEGQIPVLEKAAALSQDSQQYVYLGQAQIALYRWKDAAESLTKALDIGNLDRPGSVYMQVGTAYYNLKKYSQALQAFKEAGAFADYATQAQQWQRFVQSEIQRARAMRQ